MANYNLTASPVDQFSGAPAVADVFTVAGPGRLVGTDTVQGGAGAVIDTLRIAASLSLTVAAFANVRGLERLQISAPAGASVELDDAMVASTDLPVFEVLGAAGGDTVLGGAVLAQAMQMEGGAGDDRFEGGGGADLLRPGLGADTLRGGAGDDTVETALAELGTGDRLEGGAGDDVLRLLDSGVFTPAMFGLISGFERIEAAALGPALRLTVTAAYAIDGAALTVQGTGGDDTLNAQNAGFAAHLRGEAGQDLLTGGAFADTLAGGAGNDTMRGLDGADVLDGADGDDRLTGGEGNDWLIGGAGNDVLSGGAGADTLDLGAGIDRADGGAGNDLYRVAVADFSSIDLIVDSAGTADTVQFLDTAGQGLTIALTASGRLRGIERLLLASGNDFFLPATGFADTAGANAVTVEGGAGNDTLDVTGALRLTTPLAFLLRGGDGNDVLTGGRGADTLEGGSGADSLNGAEGADLLLVAAEGLSVLTLLNGGAGNDTLRFLDNAPVAAMALAGVSAVEILELADGGQSLVVPDALVAGLGFTGATLRGGDGDDRIDISALATGRRILVELGDGDDTLLGGAGNDTVHAGAGIDEIRLGGGTNRAIFGVNELTGLDTVEAGTAGTSDVLEVAVGAGQTLASTAFAEVTGIDTLLLDGAAGSAARLPSTLVTQSGQASVAVDVTGEGGMVVDGRAVAQGFSLSGGVGNDTLFGGGGADTLNGSSGEDRLIGGPGGDTVQLSGSTSDRDLAVLRGFNDGTVDINGTLSAGQLAQADRVFGTSFVNKLIAVDRLAFGLSSGTTFFINDGQNISLGFSAAVLPTTYEIAGNAFGSLTAVRNAVGARLTNNDPLADERIILVIGGADNTAFGVYFFEDRDDNATVDSADILRLLAIGDGDVPTFNSGRGFTLTEFDLA